MYLHLLFIIYIFTQKLCSMKNFLGLLFFFFISYLHAQAKEDVRKITAGYDVNAISKKIVESKAKSILERQRAVEKATLFGWPVRKVNDDGSIVELIKLDSFGNPVYYTTEDAAQSLATRVNHVNSGGSLNFNLNGQGMVARIWDGGRVRGTHNLFTNRVINVDDVTSSTFSQHSTHVTGSVIASNAIANARGAAYQASARTFNWTDDESEVLSEVLGGMLLSNHSYGIPLVNPVNTPPINPLFVGSYLQDARTWDEISFLSPYYLMVVSAGNNGTDNNSDPSSAGFDKLIGNKVCKNNLVVANCQDVTINAAGIITSPVVINASSSQGPADDRRIKPDITGNGTGVLSTSNGTDSATATLSGTSMASPNVMGSLLLVQQNAKNISNNFLNSATLKGLATHTADDCGQVGPDPIFGWGLLNTKACVETLNQNGLSTWVSEEVLNQGQTFTMTVKAVGGSVPLVVSGTWTDVPGAANNTGIVNSTNPALVNDLDIRVTRGSVISFPWSLTADAAADAVQNLDNKVDNVENVRVSAPVTGDYIITVTHKGTLVGGKQPFSLVVTGVTSSIALNSTSSDLAVCSNVNAAYTFSYKQNGTGTSNFSAQGLPIGMTASFAPTSLSVDGIVTMTVGNLSAITPGTYPIGIKADNGLESETRYRNITVFSNSVAAVNLISPNQNQSDVASTSTLSWDKSANFEFYKLEVSTLPNFSTLFFSQDGLTKNSQKLYNLVANTRYYWRVIPSNRCVTGNTTSAVVRTFVVGVTSCGNTFSAVDFSNSSIADVSDSTASVPIVVTGGIKIGGLKVTVGITHTYVQDMSVTLIGPAAIGSPRVVLLSQTCGEFNDVDAIFGDEFSLVNCSSASPSISGQILPEGELSDFNNLTADGEWTLFVSDPFNGDGGSITNVVLDFCKVTNSLSKVGFRNSISQIVPNPTSSMLNLKINDYSGKVQVDVIDLFGRKVDQFFIENFRDEYNFNIAHYAAGVYLFNIQTDKGIFTHKIVKE